MGLEDKYEAWRELYFSRFVSAGDAANQGANVPVERVSGETRTYAGDGTVNIAHLMQYVYASDLLGEEQPVTMAACVGTLERLSAAARDYFAGKFGFLSFPSYPGFFLRDDLMDVTCGAWKSLTTLDDEDPCFSPFTSQDQVWNLNPPLMAVALSEMYAPEVRSSALALGEAMNGYIMDNGYTVYNPYLSYVAHYLAYLPPLSKSIADRRTDREEAFEPYLRVKRGASNWYYSGGTKACHDAFSRGGRDYGHSLRTFLYRGLALILDRAWEPLLGLFGGTFKHNAINCYAAASGIWYNGRFAKSRARKTNKWLKKKGGFYNWETDFLAGDHDTIDWDLVGDWLESYPEPDTGGEMDTPIEFLCVYQWRRYRRTETGGGE